MVEKVILLSFLPHASVKYSWSSSSTGLRFNVLLHFHLFCCCSCCCFFPWRGVREHGGSSEGCWHMSPDLLEKKSSESAGAEQLLWSTLFPFLTIKVLLVKICHYACASSVVGVVGSVPPQRLWNHIKVVLYVICKVHLYGSTDTEAQLLSINRFQGCSWASQGTAGAQGSTDKGWTCKGMQSTSRTWQQVPLGHSQLPPPSCHRPGDTTRTQRPRQVGFLYSGFHTTEF